MDYEKDWDWTVEDVSILEVKCESCPEDEGEEEIIVTYLK